MKVKEFFIKVRFEHDGFHFYRDAPKEVAFLKNEHRHVFKITVQIQVFGSERELEFFMVQERLKQATRECFDVSESCEGYACKVVDKAEEVIRSLKKQLFFKRKCIVEVSEDGENSAIVKGVML